MGLKVNILSLFCIALVIVINPATAYEFRDIAGRWKILAVEGIDDSGSEKIGEDIWEFRDNLLVVHSGDFSFNPDHIEVEDDEIKVFSKSIKILQLDNKHMKVRFLGFVYLLEKTP